MLAPGSVLFFPCPGRRGEGLQAVTVTGACTCPALSGPGPPMLFVCLSPLSPGVLIPVLLGSHGSALLYLLPPWGPSGIPDLSSVPITPFFHPLLPPITILSHGLYQALGNCPLPIIGAVTPPAPLPGCVCYSLRECVYECPWGRSPCIQECRARLLSRQLSQSLLWKWGTGPPPGGHWC